MAIKTHKVTLSLDNPRVIQSGINVQSFDKQSIQISIELTKNDEVFRVPSDATIRVSLLKLARQEQKIIVDVPNTNRDSIDWIVPDYLDGYQGTVRVGVYLVSGTENVDLGYFTILSNVSDIDKMADEFVDNVFQGWEQIEADLNELNLTIAQTKLDLADDLTQIDNTIANINTLASDFTADVATKQSDVTSKYNAFDTSVTQAGQTIDDILALQPQFQSVLDETTGKDVISAPEIILARDGEVDLKARLDKEHQEVTAQLAQKATKTELNKKQDELIILDELPHDLSYYPVDSIILTNNIYWYDNFKGTKINTDKWHVYQSEPGIITQDYKIELKSTTKTQLGFIYAKNPIRKDVDGRFNVKIESLYDSETQALFEVYQRDEELLDTPPAWRDIIILLSWSSGYGLHFRYKDSKNEQNYWDDVTGSWKLFNAAQVMTNFPYVTGDILNLEILVENDYLKLSLENETQKHLEVTNPIPLSDVFGSLNKWFPYMQDVTDAYIRGIAWHDVSYKRIGDK